MKALTKVQTEAIVDEVHERLLSLSTPSSLPHKALKEWDDLKPLLIRRSDEELVNESASNKIDDLINEVREYEVEIHKDIKAIEEEVEERISDLNSFERIECKPIDWEGVNAKMEKRKDMLKTIEKLQKTHERATEAWSEFDDEVREKVHEFELEYELDVNYRWIDRESGEEPSVKFKIKDFKDKIRRQIAILSIDKNGPLTADDLIDTIVGRFMTLSKP
jgi:hypothetical protein